MPLFCYRHSHPLNLVLLGVWTLGMSITVGVVTAQYSGEIIFQVSCSMGCQQTSVTGEAGTNLRRRVWWLVSLTRCVLRVRCRRW